MKGLPFVINFDPQFGTWNFSGARLENSKEWQVVLTLYKIKARESKAAVRNELLQLKRGLGRGTTTTYSVMPNMQKDQYK